MLDDANREHGGGHDAPDEDGLTERPQLLLAGSEEASPAWGDDNNTPAAFVGDQPELVGFGLFHGSSGSGFAQSSQSRCPLGMRAPHSLHSPFWLGHFDSLMFNFFMLCFIYEATGIFDLFRVLQKIFPKKKGRQASEILFCHLPLKG